MAFNSCVVILNTQWDMLKKCISQSSDRCVDLPILSFSTSSSQCSWVQHWEYTWPCTEPRMVWLGHFKCGARPSWCAYTKGAGSMLEREQLCHVEGFFKITGYTQSSSQEASFVTGESTQYTNKWKKAPGNAHIKETQRWPWSWVGSIQVY